MPFPDCDCDHCNGLLAWRYHVLETCFVRSVRIGKDKRRVDYKRAREADLIEGAILWHRNPTGSYLRVVYSEHGFRQVRNG